MKELVLYQGVPDVPKYDSESEKESWGDSHEVDDDDVNDFEDDADDNNDDDGDNDDGYDNDDNDDDEAKSERTESDREEIPNLNQSNVEQTEEEDDRGAEQQNVSQVSGFEQVEEDSYVIVTPVIDAQKVDDLVQSSSVSFDFTSKLLNLDNTPPRLDETSTTPTPTPTTSEATTSTPALPDFASVFRFNERVTNLEKDLLKMKQVDQSSSQPQSTYEAAAALTEFELTKILIDKMEKNKSFDKANHKRELYNALRQRSRPSAGSNRGSKRRKSSKDAESSRDSRSKGKKSSSTSKDGSQPQHTSSSKSAHVEEPSHIVEDSGVQQDQEFITGDNDEQPADKETWISQAARAEEPSTSFNEIMDTSFFFLAFVLNRLNITDLTQEILVGPPFNLMKGTRKSITELEYHLEECSKATTERLDWHNPEDKPCPRRIISVTRLTIEKKYDYGHLEEIEVRRDDQQLYTFKEGDFPRLRLQDIKDMLLLVVQQKLTNLMIVERLMRTDELHKFSDGTLNDVRFALHDIAKGIRMEYLSKRKWSGLDKKQAWVII
ncbi:hypothetical protein Tco_0435012 [Tanacetum coccineum]